MASVRRMVTRNAKGHQEPARGSGEGAAKKERPSSSGLAGVVFMFLCHFAPQMPRLSIRVPPWLYGNVAGEPAEGKMPKRRSARHSDAKELLG